MARSARLGVITAPIRKSVAPGSAPRLTGSASFDDRWRIVGASATGEDHIHAAEAMPCQDAFLYGQLGPLTWAAVADGVGSERYSQHGARTATEAVGDFLLGRVEAGGTTNWLRRPEDAATELAIYCRERIVAAALLMGVPDSELSTTLQALVADEETGRLLYVALGDGHCLIETASGSVAVLGYRRRSPDLGPPTLGRASHLGFLFHQVLDLSDVAGCLLISDGLDKLFVKKGLASSTDAVAEAHVSTVLNTLRACTSETDGLGRFGKMITETRFQQDVRDDKTIVALARPRGFIPVEYPAASRYPADVRADGTAPSPADATSEVPNTPFAPKPTRVRRPFPRFGVLISLVVLILVLEIFQAGMLLRNQWTGADPGVAASTSQSSGADGEANASHVTQMPPAGKKKAQPDKGPDQSARPQGSKANPQPRLAPSPPVKAPSIRRRDSGTPARPAPPARPEKEQSPEAGATSGFDNAAAASQKNQP